MFDRLPRSLIQKATVTPGLAFRWRHSIRNNTMPDDLPFRQFVGGTAIMGESDGVEQILNRKKNNPTKNIDSCKSICELVGK